MRIGIFSECYHPTHNGVVISIDTFAKALSAKGHEIFIITPYNPHLEEKEEPNIIRIPSWGLHKDYPIGATFIAFRQGHQIKHLNLDCFHFQHPFTISNWGLKLARQLKIPTLYTYHTLITEYTHYFPGPTKWKEKIAVNVSRDFCNKIFQVITPSEPMKKVLISYGVKRPIEVIPTGIKVADFCSPFSREELYKTWKIAPEGKLLLYVARIAKEKNLDFLFESIKTLSDKRKDFQLLMVGGGPQLDYYKNKVRSLGLSEIVTFAGMQKKPGVNRFFGAADIFVFPSITETQGIVITEAMAAGIPAVAINQMGPSDIIQNNIDGFLTDLNQAHFVDKINYLLDHKDIRIKMGRQAKINAQKFSDTASADHMEKLYERITNSYRSQ